MRLGDRIVGLKLIGLRLLALSKEALKLLHGGVAAQILDRNRNAELRRKQNVELDRADRVETGFKNIGGNAKGGVAHNVGNAVKDLLLDLVLRRNDLSRLLFGNRQGALVDLLVLVERDLVDLHRHRRNHIGRLVALDELAQGFNVNRLVRDHISRNKLAAALFVERLNGRVLDPGEFADNALDLA